jgi:hypothetical protein
MSGSKQHIGPTLSKHSWSVWAICFVMLGDFGRHQVDFFQMFIQHRLLQLFDQKYRILELCNRAFEVKVLELWTLITDVSNDACAKGRTQTVWNTGTDQVQPKWFHLQQGDYMNTMRNFYKSTFRFAEFYWTVQFTYLPQPCKCSFTSPTHMSVQYHPGILCAGAPARNHGGSSPRCPNSAGATACFCYTNYTSKVAVSSFVYELKLVFTKAKN